MTCSACGEQPKNTAKDFTKAVIEINNPEALVLLRKVVIPVSMGDETSVPVTIGKYHNVLLQYETNGHIYLYSSDGIPTAITAPVPQEVLDSITELEGETADLQQQIDDLKNSPDVVDIVATYADLQAYDTSSLGDKDIIRVLVDETHDGESTYYRWNKQSDTWTFIGGVGPYYTKTETDTIIEGVYGRPKELTSEDYNWPTSTPDGIGVWLLSPGFYHVARGVKVYWYSGASGVNIAPYEFIVAEQGNSGAKSINVFDDSLFETNPDGSLALDTVFLKTSQVVDSLTSTADVLPLSANQGKVLNDKIESLSKYSTSEADTGATWIDGSPIYKKTIDTGVLPNNAMKTVQHGVGVNLKRAIKIEGYAYSQTFGINMSMSGPEIAVQVAGADIEIASSADLSAFTESYVTLYYTKTQ